MGVLWGLEDLCVTYGVWENPRRSNAALEDPMEVLWGMGEPYGSQRLWGLRESYGSQEDSRKTLWGLGESYRSQRVSVKTLWGLGESYGSHWGSGRTLWGSTGLWEDLWVTYGVWENPKRPNAALEDLMEVL